MNIRSTSKTAEALASCAVLAALAAPAAAQAQAGEPWEYAFAPYLWAAGLDGTTTVGDLSVESDHGFSDLVDKIDFGFTGAFEARKGRWGILFDAIYIKLSDDVGSARGTVDVEAVQQMYTLGGAWRALEGPTPVDLIGGLRYNYLKPTLGLGGVERGQSKDALDPYIGVRGHYPLDPRWTLVGYLDVGTFDGSDYAWQLLVGASYAWRPDRSLKFGYRQLKTKYSGERIELDTTMQGLYIGVGFRF
ncbi:outer membrane protein [Massilia oculi]|uniref:outer membrane protein n=1 Tax=Massilia oculi TaxID=945844 RepID=UPI0028AC07D6|nr:outer membrane beta-barrel protein [Massilia oculi]